MATKNNLFANAKTVVDPTPKKKKGVKEEVTVENLQIYVAIDAVRKTLKGLSEDYRRNIEEQMTSLFVDEVLSTHKKPESVKGIEGNSKASLQFRKRSSKSPLAMDEVAILKQHGIRTETVILSPAKEEKYLINPEIVGNAKLAQKVSDALREIPELRGMDILFLEPSKEAETVEIVSDQSFEDVANLTNIAVIKQVYETITTLSVGNPVFQGTFKDALKVLDDAGINFKIEDKKKSK